MGDIRLNKLAKLLVNYSTKVKKGDFVFISCNDVAKPWVVEVAKEAIKAGAHVEYSLDSEDVNETILKDSNEEQLLEGSHLNKNMLSKADVWLTAWGTRNTKMNSNVDPKKLQLKSRGAASWRKIYSERMGDGSLRWCGTQFPTYADAQEASMSLNEYEDFVYGAGLLDMEDPVSEWKKISAYQDRWVKYLNTKKELHFLSEGTDIKVKVEGKKWINCDGKANFPDGEIFTSPIENGIDGYITFSFPGIYMGKEIEGIRLEVTEGKVVKAIAQKGEDLLKMLIETDEGASYFGEVAIGTNYGIKKFTKNMLFDEKIGGTIHMAIGDSDPEAGGLNRSSIHWDMLCDMRNGGKIYADGELFYENGQFKEEILKKYNL
ncbi:thermophilic metalloprotease family protein [Clostridium argentinense CDC 2741]|uniref:Thermophilic metalloprotease family protein n=1 Tax=Clostridium argentinense CDC 2741 TaxID=1418104 RepID=A0A0C1R8Y4_9CLOT|nr:aminopeptidase [Clostridium argentinense]ARC85488.1 aminopeptidase [Clostridium argentinense]KIE46946.1 thermophilic metalloprotease family protein [Clostridium argentinense CDC 2741]NFF39999.1 aminopeptidase [Clostridium argentinense]NFP50301.1 aminopeptidase [Clostridium argentinense]NFP71942.1 aminopeptidase [Clostridium argentinense]